MNDLLKKLSDREREALRKKEQPEWTNPMLAKGQIPINSAIPDIWG